VHKIFLILFLFFIANQTLALHDIARIGADYVLNLGDTATQASSDSIDKILQREQFKNDSVRAIAAMNFSHKIFEWTKQNRKVVYDIQQRRTTKNSEGVFSIFMVLLFLLTYLKVAYGNDLEELWQSVTNANRAMQIFRTQTDSFSISSFLLTLNFILNISFFTQFSVQYFFPSYHSSSNSTTLLLIILFTSFLLIRTLLIKLIGQIFFLSDVLNLYEFHFYRIVQIVGISMLPAVLLMFVADKKFFIFPFLFSCVCLFVGLMLFLARGLSTSLKLIDN